MPIPKNIQSIVNQVQFRDVLSIATEAKEEIQSAVVNLATNEKDFSTLHTAAEDLDDHEEFDLPEETHIIRRPRVVQEIEEEEEYDAEKNARALVHTLASIDSIVLSTAVVFKCRSTAGGSKGIALMKKALEKELYGQELNDADKKLILRMKAYRENLRLLSETTFMPETERERLIAMAIDYCEISKIKVSSAGAFWANYAGSVVERVTKIIIS
jgi:hypothetical protein